MDHIRKKIVFRGTVQGVGFRPTVFRCASALGLTGFVLNRRSEVVAEVQGSPDAVDAFLPALNDVLPEAADIESIDESPQSLGPEATFIISESVSSSYVFPPIPPDLAVCSACRKELFDPRNRRYLYPFITCTQCGPRYSIVEDTPFDRENTSMVDFPQCPDCLAEYTDPNDRRFHSQTNSCRVCGPSLRPEKGDRRLPHPHLSDPVVAAIEALKAGKIVAVHGIGGFHLAVDPRHEEALRRLREDKEREKKPFALMVKDEEEAMRLVKLNSEQCKLLRSPESPIIIAPVRDGLPPHLSGVSDIGTLGVMLPYTPLHLLLFFHPETEIPYNHLVMTSGNVKGEPIITDPEEAKRKLSGTVDLFLVHDRRIIFRTDDSVVRPVPFTGVEEATADSTVGGAAVDRAAVDGTGGRKPPEVTFLRRSRGYVPRLVRPAEPVVTDTLAVGGDLKSAPAFASGNDIYLAPYIGDLENEATSKAFEEQIQRITRLYDIKPKRLVYDLHPGYFSTRWAEQQTIEVKVKVQHHHAHILSVMAEHGLPEALGLSFDGTGYGTDGTIWGGEFLHARRDGFERLGHIQPFPLPGGDAAVLSPLRIAYSILSQRVSPERAVALAGLIDEEAELVPVMVERGINAPLTSSAGRLFDAAAALLGLVHTVGFEGEGPMKLEGSAWRYHNSGSVPEQEIDSTFEWEVISEEGGKGGGPQTSGDSRFVLHFLPLLLRMAERSAADRTDYLAALFHHGFAAAACRGAVAMRGQTGINSVCLSGGVFQNMLLVKLLMQRLHKEGFSVYTNRRVPPGDGGIAVGQAYSLPNCST